MAHRDQLWFVNATKQAYPDYFRACRIIEIGSLDINGSIRRMFTGCEYVGLDVAAGPGVDAVCQGQDYDGPADNFDTAVCCEVMEHNPFWVETFRNMIRVTRPGGLVILTCASHGRPEHGTARTEPTASPLTVGLGWTYYRNLDASDFMNGVPINLDFSSWRFYRNSTSNDLYFIGFKAGSSAPANATWSMRSIAAKLALWNVTRGKWWINRVRFMMPGKGHMTGKAG